MEGKCQNCYWRKQGCAFEPISTDAHAAVLKSLITEHIHHEIHSKAPSSWQFINAGIRQGPNVAPMPTFSHTALHCSSTLQQLPFDTNSAADVESGRHRKRLKIMQEGSANSMDPVQPRLTIAHSPSKCTSPAEDTRDDKSIEGNKKAASFTGIVEPLQASATSTSLVRSGMPKSRRHILQDNSRRIAQPKSSGYQRSRDSTASVMSLKNLVNNFDAVA